MKKILIVLILTVLLNSKINFKEHIDMEKFGYIPLAVTNVSSNDVLNLRLEPSYKSRILYEIPHDAKNLISYDRKIIKKLGKNIWVSVRLEFEDGFYSGWVKAKYLKLYEKYNAIVGQDLLVIYPDFLEAENSDGWLHLYDKIGFEHYSGCDMRDAPELLDEYSRFDIKLRVYGSLLDVFDGKTYDVTTYNRVTTKNWFKKDTDGFVEKVNLYGLKGYKNIIGAEMCGVNTYFFKVNGKILVIKEPFDNNPPIPKKGKPTPKNLKFSDKDEIMRYIIKNLRVF